MFRLDHLPMGIIEIVLSVFLILLSRGKNWFTTSRWHVIGLKILAGGMLLFALGHFMKIGIVPGGKYLSDWIEVGGAFLLLSSVLIPFVNAIVRRKSAS